MTVNSINVPLSAYAPPLGPEPRSALCRRCAAIANSWRIIQHSYEFPATGPIVIDRHSWAQNSAMQEMLSSVYQISVLNLAAIAIPTAFFSTAKYSHQSLERY